MSNVLEALVYIQSELKAPKDQSAGRYRYRNIEDINEAVKPLAAKFGCAVVYSDRFEDGACISTCKLIGFNQFQSIESGNIANVYSEISADGVAYVNRSPKNMSVEQASGSASSYARKYAACGLFAIDSSENDPDRVNAKKPDSALEAAKRRMWAVLCQYAELHGREPNEVLNGVRKRPEWSETVEFFNMVTAEFSDDIAEGIANG